MKKKIGLFRMFFSQHFFSVFPFLRFLKMVISLKEK